jgi:hypothetical protein
MAEFEQHILGTLILRHGVQRRNSEVMAAAGRRRHAVFGQ